MPHRRASPSLRHELTPPSPSLGGTWSCRSCGAGVGVPRAPFPPLRCESSRAQAGDDWKTPSCVFYRVSLGPPAMPAPKPWVRVAGCWGFPLQDGHRVVQHHSPSRRPHSAQHQLSVGGGMGCPFSEVGGIQGGRKTCQMLSWPWEEATNPTTVFHAAVTVLLTHGNPGVMCRDRARGQVRERNPRQAKVPGVAQSPGPYPSEI